MIMICGIEYRLPVSRDEDWDFRLSRSSVLPFPLKLSSTQPIPSYIFRIPLPPPPSVSSSLTTHERQVDTFPLISPPTFYPIASVYAPLNQISTQH